MSKVKTNAMRILDSNKIEYKILSYETKKGEHIDGVEVAHQIGRDVSEVYKTLVAQGSSKNIYVYVIPVNENLDLKKAAKVANEKNVAMINVNDINKFTGYIRGGCSPIGMKKIYKYTAYSKKSQYIHYHFPCYACFFILQICIQLL